MQNHNCAYARYCENYEVSRCQGCRNATNDDKQYISREVDMLFEYAANTERRNNMILSEKKSYRDHMENAMPKKTDYTKLYSNKHLIKNVVFNPPVTVVLWYDGSKTIVRAGENDVFDPEKGLAMAIAKKFFGNKGNYYNNIRKHVESYEKKCAEEAAKLAKKNSKKDTADETTANGPWMIWYMDADGVIGRYYKSYKRKCNATQTANRLAKKNTGISYIVSQTDPWGEESDATCQA